MTGWLIAIAAAYVVGSIPFGVLIGRARGIDIREHGSRNIGATNVGRVLGRRLGLLCFGLDLLKGAGPVLAAGAAQGVLGRPIGDLATAEMWWWLAVAAATIAGHLASLFLRFAGGKGVATSFGAMLAMWPVLTLPAVGALVAWLTVVRVTRYVSLASMVAALALPVVLLVLVLGSAGGSTGGRLLHAAPPLLVALALGGLVIWRHRGNLARLRRGEEPKLGEPVAAPAERRDR